MDVSKLRDEIIAADAYGDAGETRRLIDKLDKIEAGNKIFEAAEAEYPRLMNLRENSRIQYDVEPTPDGEDDGFLEFYSGDETGSLKHPRPENWKKGIAGIQIRNLKTRPIDVLGDWASHEGVKTDPILSEHYRKFRESLDERQKGILKEQYQHARKKYKEDRPYEEWEEMTGMPGYFRGYAFDQWDNPKEMYRPEQLTDFDSMMEYLKSEP